MSRGASPAKGSESTYSDVRHDDRADVEDRFARSVEATLWEDGAVIVPAFGIGRTQGMLLVCETHDGPSYVDGMGTRVIELLEQHPEFVRDAETFGRARSHARFVTGRDGQRSRITDQKAAIVTTSGMLGNKDSLAVAS